MAAPPSRQPAPRARRRIRTLASFVRTETGGAAVLLAATVAALVWANSPWQGAYDALWGTYLRVGIGALAIEQDLAHWVNGALMAVFFFVIGLEVKRELQVGELRDPRAAGLPVVAALGGILVPAGVYLLVAGGDPATAGGWGIPVATDIAFALGVLALLGERVPAGLKVFLLSLAVADDIGAILIIAVAYSDGLSAPWLGAAVGVVGLIAVLRRVASSPWAYVVPAVALWVATFEAGVHATLAGVVLGLLTPLRAADGRDVLERAEHAAHPWSSYLVLPLFALANAGVALDVSALASGAPARAALAVTLGLVVGKAVGIASAALLALRLRWGRLPLGVRPRHLVAVAPLGGIGFTVSLFIADLTFDDAAVLGASKLGILAGSLVAAVAGVVALWRTTRRVPTAPRPRGEGGQARPAPAGAPGGGSGADPAAATRAP